MVLQRDMHVPVWGTALAGKTVTVDIDGFTLSAEAEADGGWRLDLTPAPGEGPVPCASAAGKSSGRRSASGGGRSGCPAAGAGTGKCVIFAGEGAAPAPAFLRKVRRWAENPAGFFCKIVQIVYTSFVDGCQGLVYNKVIFYGLAYRKRGGADHVDCRGLEGL